VRSLRAWLLRIRATLSRSAPDDAHEELTSHLQLHIDDHVRAGLTPDAARRQALLALGGMAATTDAYHDRRGLPPLESGLRDARHAMRILRKNPAFALSAIVILGLGIGANSAMFSIFNAVVLRPLPFAEPARIMRVWQVPPPQLFPGRRIFAVSPANYLDWRAQTDVFDHTAIYGFRRVSLTWQVDPEALLAAAVSSDFFNVLRVTPLAGRTLGPGDDEPGHAHVVMLGERLWRTHFGSDPGIVGQPITLNDEPFTVVGIIPQRQALPDNAQLWIPLVWTPQDRAVRSNHTYLVIARLTPGVEVQRAQVELTTISQRLAQHYPADDQGWGAVVLPLQEDLVGAVRPMLVLLLGVVGLVALIACANLANLLLARTLGRAKEIAVRTALGATRGRILQQLLTESLLLGVGAALVGLLIGQLALTGLVHSIAQYLPRAAEISVDSHVLAFTFALAVATALLAGAAPAWRLTRTNPNDALKQGLGRTGSPSGEHWVRRAFVVTEVAFALMLLVGAGLLLRTLSHLRAVDPGFDPRNLLTMTVELPASRYARPAQQVRFFDEALRRIRTIPGVESAAGIDSLPLDRLDGGSNLPVAIDGRPVRPLSEQPVVAARVITPGYLRTVQMKLVTGRDVAVSDVLDRPAVALVSQSMARQLWPNDSPMGKRLRIGLISNVPREVVGIVNDVKLASLDVHDVEATVYLPLAQVPTPFLSLVVRATDNPPERLTPAVIQSIRGLDPGQPVRNVLTMDDVIGGSLERQRFAMRLVTTFAGLALALAAVGIYSVLSYTVSQRVREIGIRLALGASTRDVLQLVMLDGLKPTFLGMGIGLLGAWALGGALNRFLFGVRAHDLMTLSAVSLIALAVSVIATFTPALRATRVEPSLALRSE